MGVEDLVSVVIPAYNAEQTLGETLESVRGQSHRSLEIIVVDDGSSDGTAAVARAHAADPRVRVLSVENGGVASARNAGIAASRGAFVAPVDADDLWHPDKIARQMAAVRAGGDDIGYVYTFYRMIDAESRVLADCGEVIEGTVYLRSILRNFVGNGSSLLIRRTALEEVGGYEPALRRQGVQGCEDYLLQILIARTWKVACVPYYLTGYRWTAGAMSTDRARMARSHCAMLDLVARRFPETPGHVLSASRAMVLSELAVRQSLRLRPLGALPNLWRALRLDPRAALDAAKVTGPRLARGMVSRRIAKLGFGASRSRQRFADMDPSADGHCPPAPPLARQLDMVALQEADFFARGAPGAVAGAAPAEATCRFAASRL